MKTQIENSLLISEDDEINIEMFYCFNMIIQNIIQAKDEKELRIKMHKDNFVRVSLYFRWGYGSNHMWLKQSKEDDRILLVEF